MIPVYLRLMDMCKRKFTVAACFLLLWIACTAFTVRTVPTDNLPCEAKVTVAVPVGYDDNISKRYPVVYLLNGHGGDHATWSKIADIDSLATAYGVIIVCPAGLDSWYWDSPVKPELRMESYITGDLVPWVDSNYRTRPLPAQRAITGLSMGGHGALWLAIRHPELFGNIGSTSGGVDLIPWPEGWNLPDVLGPYRHNEKRWRDHTVMSLLDSPSLRRLNIIFDCGTEDFFLKVNNRLHEELKARGIRHVYRTSAGAHKNSYWHRSIIPHFDFFDENFNSAESN